MANILIVAEIQKGAIRESSYELVSFARKLGGEVQSVVIGSGIAGEAEALAKRGGGKVYVADDAALASYSVDAWTRAVRAAVAASNAETVLFSNTPTGWDVAGRIAAGLDAAFVSDVFDVKPGPVFLRRVFNGKLDAEVAPAGGKVVVTVQPGATAAFDGTGAGSTEKLSVDLSGLRAKFVETRVAAAKGAVESTSRSGPGFRPSASQSEFSAPRPALKRKNQVKPSQARRAAGEVVSFFSPTRAAATLATKALSASESFSSLMWPTFSSPIE